jgi:hypothetical protein
MSLTGIAKPIIRDLSDNPERVFKMVFECLSEVRDFINRHPFMVRDGVLYKGTLVAGDNIIPHGLGRTPRGWLVTRAKSAAPVLLETARDDRNITLNSSGAPYVEIWFF